MFGLERSAAFETDSLASTRSVEFEVRSPADCEGMFDVLTYQKGGALLRMLEQYLGAERFRAGRQPLPAHARLREHRDQRPVGRHRGDQRRAGAADDGLVDLAARLPAGQRVARRRRARAAPAALRASTPTRSRRRTPTTWLVPVHVRNGGDDVDRAARRRRGPSRSRSPTRRRRSSSTPAATASTASPTATSCAAGSPGEVLGSLDTLERYNLVDDAWNEVVAGRLAAADFLDVRRGLRRRARARRVAGDRHRPARRSAGCSTTTRYPRFQARVRALLGAGRRRARRAGRRRGRPARQAARAARRRARRARRRRRRRRRVPRAGTTQRGATPGSVDPELVAAATSIVAATGDDDDYERMLGRLPRRRRRRRSSCATSTRSAEFDDEALILRTCELAMSGEVKTQNAPFLLRQCIANRRHGAAAWTFVRQHWDEANDALPDATRSCAWSTR